MKDLVRYLLDNLYLDFQGEISLDNVRQFLRGDDSREAKALLQKLIEDKGVDDLLITLAAALTELPARTLAPFSEAYLDAGEIGRAHV